jgi:hypothetical protein
MYRRTAFVLVVVLLALIQPLKAQDTATVTDRQLRLRLDQTLSDTRKSIDELSQLLARMQTLRTAVNARIARDSLTSRPIPNPTTTPAGDGGASPTANDRGRLVHGHNFNDGTIGGFGQWGGYTPRPVSIVPDPTGSGRGSVAKVVYERDPAGGGSVDVNGGMYYRPNPPGGHPDGVGFGDSIYFRADLLFPRYPGGRPARPQIDQRKLLYLKFGDPSNRSSSLVLNSWGRADGSGLDLALVSERTAGDAAVDYGLGALAWDTWHRLELQLIVNHRGVADGVVRLWLDGQLVKERSGVVIFDPSASPSSDFIYEWGVGNQQQWAPDERVPMKDYRLWDNIEFRTTRP